MQRIERLWRDVFHFTIKAFYNIFKYLEHVQGVWVKDNEVDEYCLTLIFQPVIQAHLDFFAHGYWNGHRIRSRGVPKQMFLSPLIESHCAADEEALARDPEMYGVDDAYINDISHDDGNPTALEPPTCPVDAGTVTLLHEQCKAAVPDAGDDVAVAIERYVLMRTRMHAYLGA